MIEIKDNLHGCHKVITHWRSRGIEDFNTPAQKRRLLIIDAFLKEAERDGLIISCEMPQRTFSIKIAKGQDSVLFSVREKHVRHKEKITNPKRDYLGRGYDNVLRPTGVLILSITPGYKDYRPAEFQDKESLPLENQLAAAVEALEKSLARRKAGRLENEEWKRQYEDRQRQLAHIAELESQAQQRKDDLEDKANRYKRSQSIRDYIEAVVKAHDTGQTKTNETELENWLKWANACADELDPIISGHPI